MPSADTIIQNIDEIIDEATVQLLESVSASQDDILTKLLEILRRYSNGVDLDSTTSSAAFLNSLETEINTILRTEGYFDEIDNYLINFDLLEANNIALQKEINNLTISKDLITPQKNLAISLVGENLRSGGVASGFIQPVKEVLSKSVILGGNIIDAEKELEKLILGADGATGLLERYVGQVARDAMSQYDGAVHQAVKVAYNLKVLEYVGSLVKASRAQCRKWVGIGRFTEEELKEEITWAERGGTHNDKKVSGWIKGTTLDTFTINRGGWRCRHTGIWVRG